MIYALALTGPTASGKTALSLSVATSLGCEIISLDSMQIYRLMDIGTAKATSEERAVVPHHMIDVLMPNERYSQEDYKADAMKIAEEIASRGKIPLFVGGTGLYYDALIRQGELSSPPSSPELTSRLLREAESEEGRLRLHDRLREVDPTSAEKIHPNNKRRLVRALEIYELTGKPKSYFDSLTSGKSDKIKIGLITLDVHDRENLYRRVDTRVDTMIDEGLLLEARSLYDAGYLNPDYTASQAIGYKELIEYIEGRVTLDEAIETLKMSSRRYAKRQLTWWRHHSDRQTIFIDNEDGVLKSGDALAYEAVTLALQVYENIRATDL